MASVEETQIKEHHRDGQEHTSFLQKVKDKLHLGHKQLKEGLKHNEPPVTTPGTPPVDSESAVSSQPEHELSETAVPAPPIAKPEEDSGVNDAKPVETSVTNDVEEGLGAAPVGEGEHHGGVPTSQTKLADEDIPSSEVTEDTVSSPSPPSEPTVDLNGLVGHESEHHGGTPTFLVALPDQDIPAEVTKETSEDVSDESNSRGLSGQTDSEDVSQGQEFDSAEMFNKAQQGEHHHGVPTFLVALPDQEIPEEVTPTVTSDVEDTSSKDVQEGEGHHRGVPTFLTKLDDDEIPAEVTKETSEDVSGESNSQDFSGQTDSEDVSQGQELDSAEMFSKAQQGEHHHGVPTFLVALPDQEIPEEVTPTVEDTSSKDVQEGEDHHGGVPTFLTKHNDDEIPAEESSDVAKSYVTPPLPPPSSF